MAMTSIPRTRAQPVPPEKKSQGCAGDDRELTCRVQFRLQLDDHLGGRAGADAARSTDRRCILAHYRSLEDLEARRAEDVQADLGSDTVDLDEHLEEIELLDRSESIKIELVLADVRVDVEVDLAARGRHLLTSDGAHADHVPDPTDVDHDEVGPSAAHRAGEVCDQCAAARENWRLRAWQTAMAMASSAWSSSLPSGSLTCAPSMRAI